MEDPALTHEVLRNPQLPTNNNDLRKQKAVLLRSIDSEISNDSVSEAILDSLEKLEQIYRQENTQITEWMKDAYRAVFLACSLLCLHQGNVNIQATESILDGRVSNLERLNSELLTDLRDCEKGIRVLLSNSDTLNKCKQSQSNYKDYALALTRFFVSAALAENNEIRIDKEANKEDEIRAESQRTTEKAATEELRDERPSTEKEASKEGKDQDMKECRIQGIVFKHYEVVGAKGKEIHGEMFQNKPAAPRRRYKGPARIMYTDDLDSEIVSSMGTSDAKQASVNPAVSNPSIDESLEIRLESPKRKDGDESLEIRLESPKRKDGDESLEIRLESPKRKDGDESLEIRLESPKRKDGDESLEIRLESPKGKEASPLKIYEDAKFTKRRKNKIWTPEEEDALREGVKKHGKGNWKIILDSNRDKFSGRQEVDLKDKWRNLTKWGAMSRVGFP